MKKLALALIAAVSLTATAFACPNMDHDSAQATAKKDDKAPATDAKKVDAPKADTAKAAPAKAAKDTQKKPDKVSSK